MAARTDTELVFGGSAARLHGEDTHLLGREAESAGVDAVLRDPDGPRLVLVRGERGVGRTAFVRAAGERLRADGVAVLAVDCVAGDSERPLLLALRVVMVLEEHRSAAARRRTPHKSAGETPSGAVSGPPSGAVSGALSALREGDGTAMAGALAGALAQPAPVVVVVDDAHHADTRSLSLFGELDFGRLPPGARLALTAVHRAGADGPAPGARTGGPGLERLARNPSAYEVALPRLGSGTVAALVAQRLGAVPDDGLVRRVRELSRGIPGAVDALLAAWAEQDAIRVADGHAFLGPGTPPPVLPDDDRYVVALRALGEPCWTVAGALGVLWPLGPAALPLLAAATGLSDREAGDSVGRLVDAGVLDEPSPSDAGAPQGWTFHLPLLAHAVHARLGPWERGRLSAVAVEALWADGATPAATASPVPVPVPKPSPAPSPAAAPWPPPLPPTYLPDRIAEAGSLVAPERAVAELTAAARALYPDLERQGMLRWYLGAVRLIEEPTARSLTVLRYGQAAHGSGDYATARRAAQWVVSAPAEGLEPLALYEAATLLVAATAAERDWAALSEMGAASWWDTTPLPPLATVSGRIQALWQLEKWREALALLGDTEAVWRRTPDSRALLELFGRVAEFVLGRPERFTRALTAPEAPDLPRSKAFAMVVAQLDMLLGTGDLRSATALLEARGLTPELLPAGSRFLLLHLRGRWDEALALARRPLVNGGVLNVVPGHHLLPARTAAVLLARGRVTGAARLIDSARAQGAAGPGAAGPGAAGRGAAGRGAAGRGGTGPGATDDPGASVSGPLEHVLDHVEAEVLRALGDPGRAGRVLRRGLDAADAHGSVYGTDELWASLAEVHAEAGHPRRAAACLERLERLAGRTSGGRTGGGRTGSGRTGSGRTGLLYLLTSARVLRPDSREARARLLEAVELARERGQLFETAVTLSAAARGGAGSAALLYEAYELFGATGAALWRFRTRTAMREAGLVVPGRRQATAENDHLLATLLAEGLTNRAIADVLRLSEDAVANRLSRLFARTGMRSRTEVVTAVLAGNPPAPEL
ncbi:AAA family ATPase [Streptomyces liangshanensis]|uniref:AAA family ATPase n=1 Tax=Streptomyces liangshanensis TaxID=2717324 RepID=UPI0036DC0C3C